MELFKNTNMRKEYLANIYDFDCNCQSCESNLPPFKASGSIKKADKWIRRLIGTFNESSDSNNYGMMNVDDLVEFEKSAIKYLRYNDHLHPTRETLMIQV